MPYHIDKPAKKISKKITIFQICVSEENFSTGIQSFAKEQVQKTVMDVFEAHSALLWHVIKSYAL